jgi:iron complex outermembrane receptor protein
LWEPIEKVMSIYSMYSTSFDAPPGGAYPNPDPLKPEIGQTVEGGLKLQLLDDKLLLTAAGFYITKENVVTQNSFFFATQVGEQRSQGFEFSAVGKVTEKWNLLANYAYIDSRIVEDANTAIVGKRFRNVPFNSANLWSRYDFINEEERGFGVALGAVYQGDRPGDLQNTFYLGDFTRWDAGVYARRGQLNASLYFENLFNRQYYSSSVDQFTVYPGAPFTLRGTVGVRW